MEIFLWSWLILGLVAHLYSYTAYNIIKRDPIHYMLYLVEINGDKPVEKWSDPNTNIWIFLMTLILSIICGYVSFIYILFKSIKA